MAVFQGTPGPWRWARLSPAGKVLEAPPEHVFGTNIVGPAGERVCRLTANSKEHPRVRRANARLMEAAPELFAELAGLLRCYDRDNVPTRKTVNAAGPGVLVAVTHKQAARLRELIARVTRDG